MSNNSIVSKLALFILAFEPRLAVARAVDLQDVDRQLRVQIESRLWDNSSELDLATKDAVRKAKDPDASAATLYRAIVLQTAWTFSFYYANNDNVAQFTKRLLPKLELNSYEAQKARFLAQQTWGNDQAQAMGRKLLRQQPQDELVLARLLPMVSDDKDKAAACRWVRAQEKLILARHPKLKGVIFLSAMTEIQMGNVISRERREHFLSARAIFVDYIARFHPKSKVSQIMIDDIDKALAKLPQPRQ